MDKGIAKLSKALSSERTDILAAYLHGSAVTNGLRPDSDLDIALVPIPGKQLSAVYLAELSARLQAVVGRDVDIALLSSDNLPFVMQVLAKGRVLFCKDRVALEFRLATLMGEYERYRIDRYEVEHAYAIG